MSVFVTKSFSQRKKKDTFLDTVPDHFKATGQSPYTPLHGLCIHLKTLLYCLLHLLLGFFRAKDVLYPSVSVLILPQSASQRALPEIGCCNSARCCWDGKRWRLRGGAPGSGGCWKCCFRAYFSMHKGSSGSGWSNVSSVQSLSWRVEMSCDSWNSREFEQSPETIWDPSVQKVVDVLTTVPNIWYIGPDVPVKHALSSTWERLKILKD